MCNLLQWLKLVIDNGAVISHCAQVKGCKVDFVLENVVGKYCCPDW